MSWSIQCTYNYKVDGESKKLNNAIILKINDSTVKIALCAFANN